MCWENWVTVCKGMKLDPYLLACTSDVFKMEKRKLRNCQGKNFKVGIDIGSLKKTKKSHMGMQEIQNLMYSRRHD